MKVLHVCQRDDPATGGAVRVAVELVRESTALGVDAKILFVYGGPGPFRDELPGRCLHLQTTGTASRWKDALAFLRCLATERPDLVHHHDGLAWTCLLSKFSGRTAIVTHGHLTAPEPGASLRHHVAGWVHALLPDHLIAVSAPVARSWQTAGTAPQRISVIPNGINASLFHPPTPQERHNARRDFGLPDEATVIAFVGRLQNEMKGCDDFLRIIAALPPSHWGLIAGSGPDESALHRLAVDLGIENRVRFAGFVHPTTPCHHASDLFLMTSSFEPFGMVVLEAAACGVRVVGLPAWGGVTDLLHDLRAPVAANREPAEIADLIRKTLDSPTSQLSPQSVTGTYAWLKVAQAVAKTYATLTPAPRPS